MKVRKRGLLRALLMCLVLVLTFSVCSVTAFAESTAAAEKTLNTYVKNGGGSARVQAQAEKAYSLQGGGTATYENIVTDDGMVNSRFEQLTSSAKKELLSDMNSYADAAVSAKGEVSSQTKTSWLQRLQQCNGVGSQLMSTLTEDIKPDFVSAKTVLSPFNGIFGTVLGIGAILIMAFLVLTMVLDLSYMCIPAFRMLMSGDKDDGKSGSSKIKVISHEAVSAVEIAEGGQGQSGQSGGQNKVAVGIYFKKRAVMLVILGICLLYLISGQIFGLVGMILDLVSGFFHA